MSPLDLASNAKLAWTALRTEEGALLALDEIDASVLLRRLGVTLLRPVRWIVGRSGHHFGFARRALADLYVPGCVRAVEAAGGRVQTGASVERVLVRDGRFDALALAGEGTLRARCAVLALPPHDLARAAPPQWRGAALAARSEPSACVSTYLWFDRKLTRQRFWARVWRQGNLNVDFQDLSNIRDGGSGGAPSLIACNAIAAA